MQAHTSKTGVLWLPLWSWATYIVLELCICVWILSGSYYTVWQLRRYLPSTVLSRWRTRLSVSVQFSSIQAASRERGIDWVCTGVKKVRRNVLEYRQSRRNPGKAVRGVCMSALKRTVMRIWREGTCSSKYKPENGTCWMRTVLAEWERHLQSFQIGWNASDLSYFSIPVWNTTTAYHLRNSVCTCDPWDVLYTIRTCSQATYFYNTPAWIVPEPTVYLSSQEASAGLR